MSTRIEVDALGSRELDGALAYGIQTARAVENFSISGRSIADIEGFVPAIVGIKMAAARANRRAGKLDPDIAEAIESAAEEVLRNFARSDFPVDIYHGGGGTAANMNVNEVLAHKASERLSAQLGPQRVHPNTHVNMSQSTNDVIPSAMKIAVGQELRRLKEVIIGVVDAIAQKESDFSSNVKLARTCLQDALPVTFAQQFSGYRGAFERQVLDLSRLETLCLGLPLGATAVGTGIGASASYRLHVFEELRNMMGLEFHLETNLFDALQNADFWIGVSAVLKAIAVTSSKMASDLRMMSSGPRSGFNEILLPAVQPGSSIMPGKVNPVIPEMVMQVAFRIMGNDVTVTRAAEGELDLNVWESIILESVSESIRLLRCALPLFVSRCVSGLTINSEQGRSNASASLAISAALADIFGYPAASKVAAFANSENISVSEAAVACGLLSEEDADRLFGDVEVFTDVVRAEVVVEEVRQRAGSSNAQRLRSQEGSAVERSLE